MFLFICESCYSLGFWFLHDVSVSCIPESWLYGNNIFVGSIAEAQLHVGRLLSITPYPQLPGVFFRPRLVYGSQCDCAVTRCSEVVWQAKDKLVRLHDKASSQLPTLTFFCDLAHGYSPCTAPVTDGGIEVPNDDVVVDVGARQNSKICKILYVVFPYVN